MDGQHLVQPRDREQLAQRAVAGRPAPAARDRRAPCSRRPARRGRTSPGNRSSLRSTTTRDAPSPNAADSASRSWAAVSLSTSPPTETTAAPSPLVDASRAAGPSPSNPRLVPVPTRAGSASYASFASTAMHCLTGGRRVSGWHGTERRARRRAPAVPLFRSISTPSSAATSPPSTGRRPPSDPWQNWPASLTNTVQLMTGSRFSMWMAWGDELHVLLQRRLPPRHPRREVPVGAGQAGREGVVGDLGRHRPAHRLGHHHRRRDLGRADAAVPRAQRLHRGDLPHLLLQPASAATAARSPGCCAWSARTPHA